MINVTEIDSYIWLCEIDNGPVNSLTRNVKQQLSDLIMRIDENRNLRVLIITGKGKYFCGGDDLKEAMVNSETNGLLVKNLIEFGVLMDAIASIKVPTIAAINGPAIGGGLELALTCDIRVASPSATFLAAGVNMGLTASGYRLPRTIGPAYAKRMLLTAQSIDAYKALQYGLITDLFETDNLIEKTIALAKVISNKAPLSIAATKEIINHSGTEEAKVLSQIRLQELSGSQDHGEALTAFREKRKPLFTGK